MINTLKSLTIRKFWRLKLLWNYKDSFLYESGWIQSFNTKKIIDRDGQDIPWISNAAYKILLEKNLKGLTIYEYGAGASTKFFSRQGCKVNSVEHNMEWYNHLQKEKLKNVKIIHRDLENGYVDSIAEVNTKFDIIAVDGRLRVQCFNKAIKHIKDDGIIMLDDSHREKYQEVYVMAKQEKFKSLNLWGFGNGSIEYKSTTFFYKQNNIFNI